MNWKIYCTKKKKQFSMEKCMNEKSSAKALLVELNKCICVCRIQYYNIYMKNIDDDIIFIPNNKIKALAKI